MTSLEIQKTNDRDMLYKRLVDDNRFDPLRKTERRLIYRKIHRLERERFGIGAAKSRETIED